MKEMLHTSSQRRPLLGRATPILLVTGVLLLALVIINPFREMLAPDDGWAYARMVQYALATGRYQIHPFTVVNLPVQIFLAAGLAKIFGYSLILLRCITLAFLVLALVSFYLLLREFGHTRQLAAFVTLVLLASPLVLILSLAFMTDIQFLGWLLLALLLYVRGIKRDSAWQMFLGSLAAGCAIGTRQFGMALVGGLMTAWILSTPAVRPRLRLIVAGGLIPLLAAMGQVYVGIKHPDFTQVNSLAGMHSFYQSPLLVILEEFFWRISILFQYIGMAALPLLPCVFLIPRSFWRQRVGRVPIWTYALLACAAIAFALSLSSHTARPAAQHRGLWEPLELQWVLSTYFAQSRVVMRFLDLFGIAGGGALIALLVYKLSELRSVQSLCSLPPQTRLILGAALSLLILHLPFGQLNDTYVVGFLPFVLLLIADILRSLPTHLPVLRISTAFVVSLVLAFALWLRGQYAQQQAGWDAAESLYHAGVPPDEIWGQFQWATYYGAFEEWMAEGHPVQFDDWIADRWQRAPYRVWNNSSPAAPPGWHLLAVHSYRNVVFKTRYVLTLQRDPNAPGLAKQ